MVSSCRPGAQGVGSGVTLVVTREAGMTTTRVLAMAVALAGSASAAWGHALVGLAAPEFRWKQAVGELAARSLRELRGRPVLLYFFKCHEASSVEQSGRVNDAFVRFGPQGLAVIGVSEDPTGEIAGFFGRNNCQFPGAVDDAFKGLASFGAVAAPTAVLIGPEGRVAWGGLPKDLQDHLLKAQLDRAVAPIAGDWPPQLAAVSARIATGDLAGALKALEKAGGDVTTATRDQVAAAIQAHLTAWDALIQAELDGGFADNALELLADVAGRCKGTEPGDARKARLETLKADAAVKEELKVCKLLAQAKALELKWQYAAAGALYQKAAKSHEGTKAAARAAAEAERNATYALGLVRTTCPDCRQRRTPCEAHGG
jgi:peroxiredoxin